LESKPSLQTSDFTYGTTPSKSNNDRIGPLASATAGCVTNGRHGLRYAPQLRSGNWVSFQ
ncbi:MAG: hypothetical protein OSB46_13210, partial [Alphaproteobacteria bacterium]|nr:hypothetical protein [Alphaproteobacteria bacterium]